MTIQAAGDARSTFPAILRELLEKHPQTGKRTTLKELGEAVGTRQQSISLYRNGDTQPSPDILVRIAAFFGVSVDYLLTGISSENKAINEELGLSEQAILQLKTAKQYPDTLGIIDELLSDGDFYTFIEDVSHKATNLKALMAPDAPKGPEGLNIEGYFLWDLQVFVQEFIRRELNKRDLGIDVR